MHLSLAATTHPSFEDNPTASSTTFGSCRYRPVLLEEPLKEGSAAWGVGEDYFRPGRRFLLPGPFGYSPTLGPQLPPNNPVKNLQWAAVIPMTAVEKPITAGWRTPDADEAKNHGHSGKHFYSLPRISTRVPARH